MRTKTRRSKGEERKDRAIKQQRVEIWCRTQEFELSAS